MTNSGGSGDDIDGDFYRDIKDQIQLLTDEIAALGRIPDDDPRRIDATREMRLKQRTIRRLRVFLRAVPTSETAGRSVTE